MLKKLKVGQTVVRGCSIDGVVRNIQCVLAIYSGYVSFIRVGQMKCRRYTCPQKNNYQSSKMQLTSQFCQPRLALWNRHVASALRKASEFMKTLLLSLLLLSQVAWSSTPMKTDTYENPVLDQFSEEGFVDCVFRIVERSESGKNYRLRLQATYSGEIVGMDVEVAKNIQSGFDAEMNLKKENVYRQGVVFIRTGPESDRLINALAKLYGVQDTKRQMRLEETFTAIALHQEPLQMEQQLVKIKIFGRDGEPFDEQAYYESFLNLDLKEGFVFWNEKDPDYRKPLIQGLSQ